MPLFEGPRGTVTAYGPTARALDADPNYVRVAPPLDATPAPAPAPAPAVDPAAADRRSGSREVTK